MAAAADMSRDKAPEIHRPVVRLRVLLPKPPRLLEHAPQRREDLVYTDWGSGI